jgi:hypothetical protein
MHGQIFAWSEWSHAQMSRWIGDRTSLTAELRQQQTARLSAANAVVENKDRGGISHSYFDGGSGKSGD